MLWKGGSVAVSRRRGRVDDPFHLRVACGHQYVDGAIHISAVAPQRIQNGLWHGWNRCLMQNIIYALAGLIHGVQIQNVSLSKINLVKDFLQVLELACGEVIHPAHLIALLQDCPRQRRSNKSCNTRN